MYNISKQQARKRIMEEARREGLLKAYHNTNYRVDGIPELSIRLDRIHVDLDGYLSEKGYATWAYLTAWNPGSRELPLAENRERNKLLLAEIQAGGWAYLPGIGIGDSGEWPGEESFLLFDIQKTAAMQLGAHFQQYAIVFGRIGERAELLWLTSFENI